MPYELKRLYFILLAVALVLAACGPEPDIRPDWCYTFDFTTNLHQSEFTYGEWISGEGYITEPTIDGAYILDFVHTYPVFVNAYYTEITAARYGATDGSINVNARANVFGHEPTYVGGPFVAITIPDGVDQETVPLFNTSSNVSGRTMSFNIQASQPVRLVSVKLLGLGANPFPFNECDPVTPTSTLFVPTAINTATAAPTSTDIGGETPTPDITPTHNGICVLPGEPTPTAGASPTPTALEWTWDLSSSTPPSPVTLLTTPNGWISSGGNPGGYWGVDAQVLGPNGRYFNTASITVQFPADVIVTGGAFDRRPYTVSGGTTWTSGIRLYNASNTLVHSALVNHGSQMFVWSRESRTIGYASPVRYVEWLLEGSNDNNADMVAQLDNVAVNYYYVAPPPTPWPNCTPTPTITPSISPTYTLTPTLTLTPTPLTLTPTITPTPTRTLVPIIPPTLRPTNTPGPSPTALPSNTPVTPQPTRTAIPGETLPAPTPGSGPFVPPGGDGGDGGGGGLRGLGNAVGALGSNVWSRATGWANGFAGALGNIAGAWSNAPVTALPGVPKCATQPLDSELCAIWYILTFTVFSGTLGSLIIPLAVVIVDLYFLFLFIRMVRAILTQAKKMRS